MKNKQLFGLLAFIALITVTLTGCADSTNIQSCLPAGAHVYGFWGGTWHGMIMWFSFIGRLFSDNIAVYAVNNNGAWYDFGYCGGFFFMYRMMIYILKGISSSK